MLTESEKRERNAAWKRKYYFARWASPEERKQYERERKRKYRERKKEAQ